MDVPVQGADVLLGDADHMSIMVFEGWLDFCIFLAYVAIPLQLLWITNRPPQVFDHHKISNTLSSPELVRTRLLSFSFAAFIIACGIGHGLHSAAELFSQLAVHLRGVILISKVCTCIVSIGTSLALGIWIPSLLIWMGEIEINRAGFSKLCLEELQGAEAGTNKRIGEEKAIEVIHTALRLRGNSPREQASEEHSEQEAAAMLLLTASFDAVVTLNSDLRMASRSPHLEEAFRQPVMDQPFSTYAATEEERRRLGSFLRGVHGGKGGLACKLAASFAQGWEAQVTAAKAQDTILCGLRWVKPKQPEADPVTAARLTEAALSRLASSGPQQDRQPPKPLSDVSNGSAAPSSSAVISGNARPNPRRSTDPPARDELLRWCLAARAFFRDRDITQVPEIAAVVGEFWEHVQNQLPDPQMEQMLQRLSAPNVLESQRLWLFVDIVATSCAEGPQQQFEVLSRMVVILSFLLESVLGSAVSVHSSAPFVFSATASTCSSLVSSVSAQ